MQVCEKFPIRNQNDIIDELEKTGKLKSLSEATNLLKMAGEEDNFRMKVGSYRVILKGDKKLQTLTAVAHRQNAYKRK
jgi:mRNA-degrading endonuclease RelE of RelBE toxin-antitoxin system